MPPLPEWYERTLSAQSQMNGETWGALQEHGVGEETPLRLEFFYFAPGEADAETLADFLSQETDYEVAAKPPGSGVDVWMVVGTTQPAAVSLQILNEWTEWMVLAGAENGGCEFDGWGAEIP